ncbi:DUF86 domain-containing protein [Planctomycetota bacterium]
MYDLELTINILRQISKACATIHFRFGPITQASDFNNSPQGMEKLDSICMLLIAIGESLKNLDKVTDGQLLCQYPQVDWKKAKGLRDIISHHYFDVNAEAIFDVCHSKIPEVAKTINLILADLES